MNLKYKIHLLNNDYKINNLIYCNKNQTVLFASLKNNIKLPYSCCNGSCFNCLAKILKGNIKKTKLNNNLPKNYCLTCITYPISDLILLTHQEEKYFSS